MHLQCHRDDRRDHRGIRLEGLLAHRQVRRGHHDRVLPRRQQPCLAWWLGSGGKASSLAKDGVRRLGARHLDARRRSGHDFPLAVDEVFHRGYLPACQRLGVAPWHRQDGALDGLRHRRKMGYLLLCEYRRALASAEAHCLAMGARL